MTISKQDLLTAILAMDSYNRGYDQGIKGLGGLGSGIGTALLWPSSGTLTPAEVFLSRAKALEDRGDVPVMTWCHALPLKMQDPETGQALQTVMTRGLKPFIDAELVHAPIRSGSPGPLIAPVMDTALALMTEGVPGVEKRKLPKLPPMQKGGPPMYVVGER